MKKHFLTALSLGLLASASLSVFAQSPSTPADVDSRLKALEDQSGRLHYFGLLHVSDQMWNSTGSFKGTDTFFGDSGHVPEVGLDLFLTYKVNENWKVVLEEEAVRSFRSGGYGTSPKDEGTAAGNQMLDQMYAQGTYGPVTLTAGKWDYVPCYGAVLNMADRAMSGVQVAVGKEYYAKLSYGYLRQNWTGAPLNPNLVSLGSWSTEGVVAGQAATITFNGGDNHYTALEAGAALLPKLNVKAAYHRISTPGGVSPTITLADNTVIHTGPTDSTSFNLWEVGADTTVIPGVRLWATYEQSNADTQNKMYMGGFDIGHPDFKHAGAWHLSMRYVKEEANSSVGPCNDWWITGINMANRTFNGIEGPQLFASYTLQKNVNFMVWAGSSKATNGADGHQKTAKLCMNFFF
ncbi:hypothetical protein [Holophaga foetida]|uniref:hypothetical protein n=1 Tax=Holophaga foetida TaxID=35839 RepID=UPI00024721A5|nr:hypothetical protein [Holophaga foetida]